MPMGIFRSKTYLFRTRCGGIENIYRCTILLYCGQLNTIICCIILHDTVTRMNYLTMKKVPIISALFDCYNMAESMGFEPTVACTTPPFQDGALNRSANSPTTAQ